MIAVMMMLVMINTTKNNIEMGMKRGKGKEEKALIRTTIYLQFNALPNHAFE